MYLRRIPVWYLSYSLVRNKICLIFNQKIDVFMYSVFITLKILFLSLYFFSLYFNVYDLKKKHIT